MALLDLCREWGGAGGECVSYVSDVEVLAHERVERGGGVRARAGGQRAAVPQQHAAHGRLLAAARAAQLEHRLN